MSIFIKNYIFNLNAIIYFLNIFLITKNALYFDQLIEKYR